MAATAVSQVGDIVLDVVLTDKNGWQIVSLLRIRIRVAHAVDRHQSSAVARGIGMEVRIENIVRKEIVREFFCVGSERNITRCIRSIAGDAMGLDRIDIDLEAFVGDTADVYVDAWVDAGRGNRNGTTRRANHLGSRFRVLRGSHGDSPRGTDGRKIG